MRLPPRAIASAIVLLLAATAVGSTTPPSSSSSSSSSSLPTSSPPTPPTPVSTSAPATTTAPLVVDFSGVPAPAARALDGSRVEAGRTVYVARCQGCHGVSGAGDGPVGRLLKPKAQAFGDALWQARVTDDELRRTIVLGGAATKKAATMPPAKDLAPEAVDALVAFVRSLRAPHGTASVTVTRPDGAAVVAAAVADAEGRARVVVFGVSGPATVRGIVDPAGAAACSFDVGEAAGTTLTCAAKR